MRTRFTRCAALLLVAVPLAAQQKPMAPRPLGPVEHTATEHLGAVSTTRALSDGRVLVNDMIGRRVLLFDKTLEKFTVVADTTSATGNAYAARFAGLLAWKGDSSVFVDPQSLSMLLIDPNGQIGRVMSFPRPQDAMSFVAGNGGIPGLDGGGRLVYRAPPQIRFGPRPGGPGGPGGQPGAQGGPPPMPDIPDSVAVVRVELATRKLDTLTFVKVPKTRLTQVTDTSGRMMMTAVIHPLPQVDDWAVLSDGSVAVVRGLDYHVEFYHPDGTKTQSGRIAFDWRHLDDSAKAAFIDSTKVAMEKVRANAMAQMRANGGPNPGAMAAMAGMEGGAMAGAQIMVFRGGGPDGPGRGGENPRPRNETQGPNFANFQMPPLQFVPPSELPDYAPPFTTGAARADQQGNLWVRTTTTSNGGPVYDVINTKGELIDRIAIPAGRVISGFGPDGIVFMGVRDATGVKMEQARWK